MKGAKPDVSPKCLILSLIQQSIAVRFFTDPWDTRQCQLIIVHHKLVQLCTVTVDIIANAIFAPTPLTFKQQPKHFPDRYGLKPK